MRLGHPLGVLTENLDIVVDTRQPHGVNLGGRTVTGQIGHISLGSQLMKRPACLDGEGDIHHPPFQAVLADGSHGSRRTVATTLRTAMVLHLHHQACGALALPQYPKQVLQLRHTFPVPQPQLLAGGIGGILGRNALEGTVVIHHDMAVARQPDVCLGAIDTQVQRPPERGARVLGRALRHPVAAMGNDLCTNCLRQRGGSR